MDRKTTNLIPSDTLVEWDRSFVWHPFTPMKAWYAENKDIVVGSSVGIGNFSSIPKRRRYIDGVSSALVQRSTGIVFRNSMRRSKRQLEKIAHTTLLGLANVPSILLAKRLVELAQRGGLGLGKVFYSDDGSTARRSRLQNGLSILEESSASRGRNSWPLNNAYHGDTIGAVSVGGIPIFHQAFRGLTFPVDFMAAPPESVSNAQFSQAIADLDARLAAHGSTYAGIVVEPLIQGAGGMITHKAGFLRELRRLADKHDILLIADEVMTGFGRTGRMFACEHEGVTPDLLCLSKGLTAGYMPLGVTMTTPKIFNNFYADPREGKTFFHGHTFTGHPLACAVACASLALFESNRLLEHVGQLSPILAEMLDQAMGKPFVKEVRRCGMIGAIELGDTRRNGSGSDVSAFPYHWRVGGALCTKMRTLGLMMRPLADTIVIMPPLAIREENMRTLCNGVLESLKWVGQIIAEREKQDLIEQRDAS